MDVVNQIINQSSLQGMPLWFKTLAIAALLTIISLIVATLIMLFKEGVDITITYGYLYDG